MSRCRSFKLSHVMHRDERDVIARDPRGVTIDKATSSSKYH